MVRRSAPTGCDALAVPLNWTGKGRGFEANQYSPAGGADRVDGIFAWMRGSRRRIGLIRRAVLVLLVFALWFAALVLLTG